MNEASVILILIRILRGDTTGQDLTIARDTDRLIRLAEMHRVVYQLLQFARQHPGFFGKEQAARLEDHCRQAALRSLTQLQELKRIAAAFQENSLDFAVIKGPQLSRMLYGREALKESIDLDIMLVSPPDAVRAQALLTGLGFTRCTLDDYRSAFAKRFYIHAKREVQYIAPATRNVIDLHIKPGANAYLTARFFRGFFAGLGSFDLEGVGLPVLPPEKYLVYLCYHGSLHQFSRLAWLLDIRTFIRQLKNTFDPQALLDMARPMHMDRGVLLAFRLLHEYFGDKIPDNFNGQTLYSERLNRLAKMCNRMLDQDERYSYTLKGRAGKLIYMMLLIRGIAGKVDFIYGIMIRRLAGGLKSKWGQSRSKL